MACRVAEGPQSVERQQRQTGKTRCFLIGGEGAPASIRALCFEENGGAHRGLQAQGQQSQARRLEAHLDGAPKERPATAGELATVEAGKEAINGYVHVASLSPEPAPVKISSLAPIKLF